MPNAPWNNNITTTNGNSSAGPPPHSNRHHQQNNNALPPSHFQANPVDIAAPYPGMGYPYTPCKSPKTPHSTSASSSTVATIATPQPPSLSHSNRRTTMREGELEEQASASGAEGQGAGGMTEGESEILTDVDSIMETNSVVSGRGRFKELATSPPSNSTEV
jgi:hypothetical protein